MRLARRVGIAIGGGLLVLVGTVLALPGIPGPGVAVMLLGLGVLSLEFERPRIWLDAIKRRFRAFMQWWRGKRDALKHRFRAFTQRWRRKSVPGDREK
jgi:hypothetical protein